MLGLSTETLRQIRQHGAERDSPGVAEVRNREMAMSVDDMALVRPAIIRLILDRKPVRLDSILSQIKSTTPAWTWGRTTLSKAMQALGITFRLTKDWHYDRLREDEANQLRRARYLKYGLSWPLG